MTPVAISLIAGIGCLIVAIIGGAIKIEGSQLPPISPRGRGALALLGLVLCAPYALDLVVQAASPVPRGTIVAWYSRDGSVPVGWALCNGSADTPDLRNRFLLGTTDPSEVGTTGGSTSHTHNLTITLPESGRKGSDLEWAKTPWANGPNPVQGGSQVSFSATAENTPPFARVVFIIKK